MMDSFSFSGFVIPLFITPSPAQTNPTPIIIDPVSLNSPINPLTSPANSNILIE